jgi:hypothetical protein
MTTTGPLLTLLYYLTVLIALAALYVGGDVTATGFIYQTF